MSIVSQKPVAIAENEGIEQIEAHMLNMEQADCPVSHHFGPGIYVREVTLPKGIIAVGHAQKFDHLNIMLTGKVAMVDGDNIRVLEAPMIFTGKPGRKAGYIMETCVWQNVYATDETDIDKLEAMFLDKSDTWLNHDDKLSHFKKENRSDDRDDFLAMISEYGISADTVREQSEDQSDQIEMPNEWRSVTSVRDSDIEGKGLFLSWPVDSGTMIAPARLMGKRTPAGRFVNHSKNPNCKFVKNSADDIYLVAISDISGCLGGDKGEELTVDYRQALSLSGIGEYQLCQE